MRTRYRRRAIACVAAFSLLATACATGEGDPAADGGEDTAATDDTDTTEEGDVGEAEFPDREQFMLWTHAAGNPEEFETIQEIMNDFNESQEQWEVVHEAFPQDAYNDSVIGAALADNLPCVLDVDGPLVANWAWAGYLAPLDLDQQVLDRFVDSAIGTYQDEVYAVGFWDVVVALYGRESVLEEEGIRIPTVDDPWSRDEFDDALEALGARDEFDYALDVGTAWGGEWWPYAFSPWLQSFGGDLIDRDTYLTAEDVLNGEEAVEWGEWFQSLFERGLVEAGSADEDRIGFSQGEVAMMWDGVWRAGEALETFGDDAVILPPPDFGDGAYTGGGSWQWAISSQCENPEAAREYLEFSLQPEYVAAFADRINLIPSMPEATELTENFAEGSDLEIFNEFVERFVLVRPETPAYLVISNEFEKAAMDIMNGADVQNALDMAVDAIDRDIETNNGYGY
jgi:multiple sugar transport system substrate-binding protein